MPQEVIDSLRKLLAELDLDPEAEHPERQRLLRLGRRMENLSAEVLDLAGKMESAYPRYGLEVRLETVRLLHSLAATFELLRKSANKIVEPLEELACRQMLAEERDRLSTPKFTHWPEVDLHVGLPAPSNPRFAVFVAWWNTHRREVTDTENLKSLCKLLLADGQSLPPGIDAHIVTKIRTRKRNG